MRRPGLSREILQRKVIKDPVLCIWKPGDIWKQDDYAVILVKGLYKVLPLPVTSTYEFILGCSYTTLPRVTMSIHCKVVSGLPFFF